MLGCVGTGQGLGRAQPPASPQVPREPLFVTRYIGGISLRVQTLKVRTYYDSPFLIAFCQAMKSHSIGSEVTCSTSWLCFGAAY